MYICHINILNIHIYECKSTELNQVIHHVQVGPLVEPSTFTLSPQVLPCTYNVKLQKSNVVRWSITNLDSIRVCCLNTIVSTRNGWSTALNFMLLSFKLLVDGIAFTL